MKVISSVILSLFICCMSYGQTTFRMPASLNAGSEMVEDAIESTIVTIRQDYALEDRSGQRFGRGGGSCFNSADHFGFQTTEGLLVFDDILTPWADDPDILPYMDDYTPVVISTVVDSSKVTVLDGACLIKDSLYTQGLVVSRKGSLSKSGWFVWMTGRGDSYALSIYRKDMPGQSDSGEIIVLPPDMADPIIGGFYVTPDISAPGTISFSLEAYFKPCAGDPSRWSVVSLKTNEVKKSAGTGLTPLTNSPQDEE